MMRLAMTMFGGMMDEKVLREKLRTYICKELIRDASYPLTDTEGIISGGLMDSFSLAEFAVYAEKEFGVYIPDSDLTVAKMNTLDQMTARVMQGA
jgi:acyl carrier protein